MQGTKFWWLTISLNAVLITAVFGSIIFEKNPCPDFRPLRNTFLHFPRLNQRCFSEDEMRDAVLLVFANKQDWRFDPFFRGEPSQPSEPVPWTCFKVSLNWWVYRVSEPSTVNSIVFCARTCQMPWQQQRQTLSLACSSPVDFCDGFVSTTGPWVVGEVNIFAVCCIEKLGSAGTLSTNYTKVSKVYYGWSFLFTIIKPHVFWHSSFGFGYLSFFGILGKNKPQVTEKLGLHNLRDLDTKDLHSIFFVLGWRVKLRFFHLERTHRFFFLWHYIVKGNNGNQTHGLFWRCEKIPGHRQWFIQSACATTGDGLYEAGGWSWRRKP